MTVERILCLSFDAVSIYTEAKAVVKSSELKFPMQMYKVLRLIRFGKVRNGHKNAFTLIYYYFN
jgi:hypothetical protein